MKTSKKTIGFAHSVVALAVAAVFSPANAQEVDLDDLTAPGNSISLGVGLSSGDAKDRARFGMFNGLRDGDSKGLLGFSYLKRDANSGTWMGFEGRNLGLDNRELGFSYRELGDMKLNIEYGELVRHDPRTINTSMQGAGGTTPTISLLATPGSGQDVNLELKRKALGVIFEKQFGSVQLEVNFKNEDKDGARLFGKGFACGAGWSSAAMTAANGGSAICAGTSSAVLLLPEPVNSNIKQFDAKLNYSSGKLNLSGGYYGSFYTNSNGSIRPNIVGTVFGNQNGGLQAADAALAATMGLPVALQPDNQAHQVFVAGNYSITPKTRVNFKYSFARATQKDSFTGMGLTGAPGGRDNLGGMIDTTRAQVGFSAHPLDKLHLHGDVVYDSKKNRTPLDLYNVFYAPNSAAAVAYRYTNGNQSPKKLDSKLEGTYSLPMDYKLTAGVKYEREDFGAFTFSDLAGGVSGLKQKMEEKGYRLELRKSVSETFTGSVGFSRSNKTGDSPWLSPNGLPRTGVTEVSDQAIYARNAIFPFIYVNRVRDKFRFMGNWTPTEQLTLQAFLDAGMDQYTPPSEHGLRKTKANNLSLDAEYAVSDAWKVNAYMSRGVQSRDSGHSTGYDAMVTDTADAFGVGVNGKPTSRLQVGADFTMLNDRLSYKQTLDAFNTNATNTALVSAGGLPDVTYGLVRLKLFGMYALDKTSYVRLDYIHNRSTFNEWTYNYNGVPFLYSDNSTINAQQKQVVNFVGASYIYKFQ